jgi:hypothetical protein
MTAPVGITDASLMGEGDWRRLERGGLRIGPEDSANAARGAVVVLGALLNDWDLRCLRRKAADRGGLFEPTGESGTVDGEG